MSAVVEFVKKHNGLIIGETKVEAFTLVHANTEDIWGTFPAPADGEEIASRVSELSNELPSGRHSIRVQAVDQRRGVVAQMAIAIDGRSTHAKSASKDYEALSRALRMNVETADQQMESQSRRSQLVESRAADIEGRYTELLIQSHEMFSQMQQMVLRRETEHFDAAERQAQIEGIKVIAQQFAPVAQVAAGFLGEWMEAKSLEWKAAKGAKKPPEQATPEKEETDGSPSETTKS